MSDESTVFIRVSIGRNVGSEPMHDERWIAFQESVVFSIGLAVDNNVEDCVDIQHSNGAWKGDPEESAHISLLWTTTTSDLPGYIARIRAVLGGMLKIDARDYDQEAIAFLVTDTFLVPAQ